MDRRTLLASGGLGLSTATAGCLSRGIDYAEGVVNQDDSEEWPERFFSPYHYLPIEPNTPLSQWADGAGTDYLHVGFVLAGPNGQPTWNGDPAHVVGESSFDGDIESFQAQGGRIAVSFGGGVGTYLAEAVEDPEELAAVFERVMDTYGVEYFDIDEEQPEQAVFDRRNEALARLQERRPELKVAYTLPASPYGVAELPVIDSAIAHGVEIDLVNLMTMNYGSLRPSGERCIWSLQGTFNRLSGRFRDLSRDELWSMIGATPMLGENDVGGAFYPDDAERLREFAEDRGLGLLSFWSVERDNSGPEGEISSQHSGIDQEGFEFSQIFNDHNS